MHKLKYKKLITAFTGVRKPPNFAEVIQWLRGNQITIDSETLFKDSANRGDYREPQQGVALTFTGTQDLDFGVGMAGQTITYYNGTTETTFVLDGSGKLTGFSGTIGYMYQKSGATWLHSWPVCDWKFDSVSYPSVLSDQVREGSEVDVQIQNATLSAVWGIDNRMKGIRDVRTEFNGEGGSVRENLLKYSEQFDNPIWAKNSVSVLANQGIAPDGNNTADKLTFSSQYSRLNQVDIITTPGETATLYLWIKNIDGNTALNLRGIGSALIYNQEINITNEWALYSATFTHNGTNNIGLELQDRNASGLGSCLIWGAQIIKGDFPILYVKTEATAYPLANYPRQLTSAGTLLDTDTTGGEAQFKGKVPLHAERVESNCLVGDGAAYVDCGTLDITSWTKFYSSGWFFGDSAGLGITTYLFAINHSGADDIRIFIAGSTNKINFELDDGTSSSVISANTYRDDKFYYYESTFDGADLNLKIYDSALNLLENISGAGSFDFAGAVGTFTLLGRGATLPFIGEVFNITVAETPTTNVHHFPTAEGGKHDKIYSTTSNVVGTITNADLSTVWGTQPFYENNMDNGFDLWTLDSDPTVILRVPLKTDGTSIKGDGDTITGYTWVSKNLGTTKYGHNNAETGLKQPIAPVIYNADQLFDVPIMYNSDPVNTVANVLYYDDFVADYEYKHIWFWDVFTRPPFKYNSVIYSTPQDNPLLSDILRYVNANQPLQDKNGVNLLTDTGEQIYVLKEGVK
jgi:hypothetical protein